MQNTRKPTVIVQGNPDGDHYRFYCNGCDSQCTLFESDVNPEILSDPMRVANGIEQTRSHLQTLLDAAESGDQDAGMRLTFIAARLIPPM